MSGESILVLREGEAAPDGKEIMRVVGRVIEPGGPHLYSRAFVVAVRDAGAVSEREPRCPFCGGTLSRCAFFDEEAVDGWECDNCKSATIGYEVPADPGAWDWPCSAPSSAGSSEGDTNAGGETT